MFTLALIETLRWLKLAISIIIALPTTTEAKRDSAMHFPL